MSQLYEPKYRTLTTKHSYVSEKHIKLGKMSGGGITNSYKSTYFGLFFFTFAICTGVLLYSTVLQTFLLV